MTDGAKVDGELSQMIAVGHSIKARKAFLRMMSGMATDELRSRESELRTLTSVFLPRFKKQYREINELISRRIDSTLNGTQSWSGAGISPNAPTHQVDPKAVKRSEEPVESQDRGIEGRQFEALVAEIRPLGFTKSSEVSKHIVKSKLARKYSHISGVLTMERGGEQWAFVGGFPPRIYARLCRELGLGNEGSDASPTDFIPFSDME